MPPHGWAPRGSMCSAEKSLRNRQYAGTGRCDIFSALANYAPSFNLTPNIVNNEDYAHVTGTEHHIPGFRFVPRTGVIYVMHEAMAHGFTYNDPQWANLGQGSPETGPLPEAPPRVEQLAINPLHQQYSPVGGNKDLCQAVADLYNTIYRKDKASKYTRDNVSIASGGRLALTRIASALGNVNMGHFIPDYTAYEELLSVFKAFSAIPILLDAEDNYKIPPGTLKREILGRGLSALLVSNPCNPTGQMVEGEELRKWCQIARDTQCSLILDEFYSHYIYSGWEGQAKMVSAAAFVEDVESDPIIIVDGLTKNWRYPGWRISWTLGPKSVIETIASAGSFLDGGANHPFPKRSRRPARTATRIAGKPRYSESLRQKTLLRVEPPPSNRVFH